jgi:HEAT repeat protein
MAAALLGGACSANDGPDFRAGDPNRKLDAIVDSARRGDEADQARLIEQLDSDDPAVRLAAILALERLTGETRGYRYDDPPARRADAVAAWTRAAAEETGPGGAGPRGDGDGIEADG